MAYPKEFDAWFVYHAPKGDQVERYQQIRDKAREFAEVINDCCPAGPDRTTAFRKIREAMMTANASIACGE